MSKTKGEGRSSAEKSTSVHVTAEYRRRRKAAIAAEDARYDTLCGPVTVTHPKES